MRMGSVVGFSRGGAWLPLVLGTLNNGPPKGFDSPALRIKKDSNWSSIGCGVETPSFRCQIEEQTTRPRHIGIVSHAARGNNQAFVFHVAVIFSCELRAS